jgi:hypothetical protein
MPLRAVPGVILATLLLVACPEPPPAPVLDQVEAGAPEAAEDAPGAAGCDDVERPPVQGGEHLIGDQEPPVAYSSTPPTSGWHASGALEVRIHDEHDSLSEPQQVSVLEAGGVVVTHHGLAEGDRRRLEEFISQRYEGRVAVTPYDQLEPGDVAVTAWGVLQRCHGVNLEAVEAFVQEYAAGEPVIPGHDR